MFIVVTLRDHEDKSHKSVQLEFEAEATIKQLKDEILTSFQVAIRCQEIFDRNGIRIDLFSGSLQNAGLEDDDTLILKHSSLPEWTVFLLASDIPKNTPRAAKKKQVLEALHVLQCLYTEGFFSTYADFAIRRIKFIRAFSEYIDDHDQNILSSFNFFRLEYLFEPEE